MLQQERQWNGISSFIKNIQQISATHTMCERWWCYKHLIYILYSEENIIVVWKPFSILTFLLLSIILYLIPSKMTHNNNKFVIVSLFSLETRSYKWKSPCTFTSSLFCILLCGIYKCILSNTCNKFQFFFLLLHLQLYTTHSFSFELNLSRWMRNKTINNDFIVVYRRNKLPDGFKIKGKGTIHWVESTKNGCVYSWHSDAFSFAFRF